MPATYPTARWVRIEPRGVSWRVSFLDAEQNYLGGDLAAPGLDKPVRDQLLVVSSLLIGHRLTAGDVDGWERGDDGNILVPVRHLD